MRSAGERDLDDGPATTAVGHEAAIAEAVERRYRNLVDHTPHGICVHQDGRVVYVNPVGMRRMGARSSDEAVGHLITEFVHADSIPSMLARIAMLRNQGDASAPAEAVLVALDGTTIDVEVISALTLWEGQPAYQVMFRDVTAEKAAQAVVHYQAALVNHVSDAIIATTGSGIVTSWNPAAEAIYGRRAAQALALPVGEAVGAPLDPAAIIIGGGVVRTTHYASDGAALAVRVSAAAMDNGYVLVCSDYTALRHAEQRFRTVVDSLAEGVVVIRSDRQVESANPAATRILGIARSNSAVNFDDRALGFALYDESGQLLATDLHPVEVVLRTGRETNQLAAHADATELGGKLCRGLANRLRISRGEAARRIAEATDLGQRQAITGEPLAPWLSATAEAQREGRIGAEAVRVIRGFFHRLPEAVDVETREHAEAQLGRAGRGASPRRAGQAGRAARRLPQPRRTFHRRRPGAPTRGGVGQPRHRRHESDQRVFDPRGPRQLRCGAGQTGRPGHGQPRRPNPVCQRHTVAAGHRGRHPKRCPTQPRRPGRADPRGAGLR